MSEVSAEQQLPFFGKFPVVAQKIVPHLLEASFEELTDFQVAFTEFDLHLLQHVWTWLSEGP